MAPTNSILQQANTTVSVGRKPGYARRLFTIATAAVVMSMAVSSTVHAQNWTSLLQNEPTSARDYGRNEALRSSNARLAEVVEIQQVDIKNTRSVNFGSVVGAALGTAAAREIKDSNTRNIARIIGAGIGGAAGSKAQQRLTQRDGVAVFIREIDRNGRSKTTQVVQDNDQPLRIGDIVTVTGSGSRTRIRPLSPEAQAHLRGQSIQEAPRFNTLEERRNSQPSYDQSRPSPSGPGYR